MPQAARSQAVGHELWFLPLCAGAQPLCFPCDAQGTVLLDALAPRARDNYLYARAMRGRVYRLPTVKACVHLESV